MSDPNVKTSDIPMEDCPACTGTGIGKHGPPDVSICTRCDGRGFYPAGQWPCSVCHAADYVAGCVECHEEHGVHECGYDRTTTVCPNFELFEEAAEKAEWIMEKTNA